MYLQLQGLSQEEGMRAISLLYLHESEELCLKQITQDIESQGTAILILFDGHIPLLPG